MKKTIILFAAIAATAAAAQIGVPMHGTGGAFRPAADPTTRSPGGTTVTWPEATVVDRARSFTVPARPTFGAPRVPRIEAVRPRPTKSTR